MGPSPMDESRNRAAVSELVEGAIRGLPGCFDALVVRFQDMAVGTAYGWLRDLAQAEDAAQEAFVEVYRNLDRLEEPAAFPGFLRRVVLKHCDRRTRRPVRELAAPDPGAQSAAPAPSADASLARADEHALVRAAVEALPSGERLVVALHYLAGLPQKDVADWLELPLSTVKKRLHTARGHIRDALENQMEETLEAMRPSRNQHFSDTVRLFLGIREGDVDGVRALLERTPSLAEAEEAWDHELSRKHALPVPTGGTPLVRAAQRNQLAMIDLLLDFGAEVDRSCPCAGGESALWAAVASGQVEATRHLLERGASPDHASFADHAPLHVAALRGYDEIVELLCEHGADGTRRDSHDRTPADWARQKGHDELADLLADRFASRAPDIARPRGAELPSFATGIKAVDLLAPILPGSLVTARFDSGLGTVILLAELSARWHRKMGGEGPAVIWVGWEHQSVDESEMEHAFAELDLGQRAELVFSKASDDEETRRGTMARAVARARELQEAGVRHPLIVAFAQRGRRAELEASLPALLDAGGERITTIVAERGGDPSADTGPVRTPFEVRLSFDPMLAKLGHFPALHPLHSRSAHLVPGCVGKRHCALAERARALFQRQRELVPDLKNGDPDQMTPEERLVVARARRLQAYLTQPFEVAEPFTGEPMREIAIADTLDDTEAVLDGALDDLNPGWAVYKGRLSEALEAAAAHARG